MSGEAESVVQGDLGPVQLLRQKSTGRVLCLYAGADFVEELELYKTYKITDMEKMFRRYERFGSEAYAVHGRVVIAKEFPLSSSVDKQCTSWCVPAPQPPPTVFRPVPCLSTVLINELKERKAYWRLKMRYFITDDLNCTRTILAPQLLKMCNDTPSDIEWTDVSVGRKEILQVVHASLTSKTAFQDYFD